MEYNDFLISTPEEFEKIAKEYSKMLKNNSLKKIGEEVLGLINSLSFVYKIILKNSRNQKLSNLIKPLKSPLPEESSKLSLLFETSCNATSPFFQPKNLFTLRNCVKVLIEKEAELVSKLVCSLPLVSSRQIEKSISFHLDSIKILTKLI